MTHQSVFLFKLAESEQASVTTSIWVVLRGVVCFVP